MFTTDTRSEARAPQAPAAGPAQRRDPGLSGPAAAFRLMGPIDLWRVIGWVTGGIGWILVMVALGLLAAFIVPMVVKPRYTAYADILIDPSNLQVVSRDVFEPRGQRDSQLLDIESKMRVLVSGNVLAQVIESLSLTGDEEFVPTRPGFSLSGLLGGGAEDGPAIAPEVIALRNLGERVSVHREERSYVVTLGVRTETPEKSVLVANAIVEAFQQEVARAEAQSAGRVGESLVARLDDLRAAVQVAAERVEAFKRERGISTTQTGTELESRQVLDQINTGMVAAQSAVIAAQTRYDELRQLGATGASSSEALASPTIAALRAQQASLEAEAVTLNVRFGPRHPSVAALGPQIAAIQGQVDAELARIVSAARTDLEQAEAALLRVQREAETQRGAVFANNDDLVALRELEREREAQASVYEASLVRAREIAERQELDTTNIRMITPPVLPRERSFPPRRVILLAAGILGGGMAGVGLALVLGFWRDYRIASRTARQIEDAPRAAKPATGAAQRLARTGGPASTLIPTRATPPGPA
ncbi:lipopolysaccharide biosynthesis protein [Arsenicitalea aurantiaca]|uniref:Lipopolysaccharide biosynthesis protein n=1 Tax=Arsenicitalea aurantiaca TaxID=1783274 RepID=A0A433XKI0_9HYPH|nr:GumC family protein [Arsenicitalea aurantiaca]RUT34587.1 lipopolysaccharide biosynthesis protein [Arsenicitalea aurantiaca]